MDFFASQDKARRKTKLLVFYFVVAVISLIVVGYLAGVIITNVSGGSGSRHHHYENAAPLVLWNPKLFLGVTLGTLAVILIGSAYKTASLSGGGGTVATLMGGRLVASNTTDADERKLMNVVEEMAIASGVPVPQVYVLEHEEGINAFAAGHSPSDAAIGVTRGGIRHLSRDQLQGVIGHEFSHILNGDMRLNIRLMGIIFGLICLATIGRILLNTRSGRNSKDKNPLPLIGLVLIVLGGIGVLFGRLIQAAVSRQREFLADASAVQFTRNPDGLSGALQKIGREGYGSKLESEHAPDMCHMFFCNGLRSAMIGAMATHPPIEERIRAIDASWDGSFREIDDEPKDNVRKNGKRPPSMPDAFRTVLGGVIVSGESAAPPRIMESREIMPSVGNPTPQHLRYAQELREALPESIRNSSNEPLDSVALIYAMLLSDDESIRAKQLNELDHRVEKGIGEKTALLYPDVTTTAKRARLPMVNLASGALRELSVEQFDEFSRTMQWLIESDNQISLFEFVLQKIVLHHLGRHFSKAKPPVVQFYSIKPLVPDCVLLISALAHLGSNDPSEAASFFAKGATYLSAPIGSFGLLPREQCGVNEIGAALDRVAQAVPTIKRNLIEACVYTVGADGVLQEGETELLRAIADTLDCPIPPMIHGLDSATH